MLDEAAELATALGEAQNAQIMAESLVVNAQNEIRKLKKQLESANKRILSLEAANVSMDSLLQEYRIAYKPSKVASALALDRG